MAAAHSRRPLETPRPYALILIALVVGTISALLYPRRWTSTEALLGAYLSAVWTLPIGISIIALVGAVLSRRALQRPAGVPDPIFCEELLVVQVPTVGRHDIMPALTRSVESFERALPSHFLHWRVDVVAEEDSEAREELERLQSSNVRVLYVPRDYRTPRGTERKARANHWIDRQRLRDGESRPDVWVLHMDDDTGIGFDSARELARFIIDNPISKRRAKHVAQGVLTYPRQFSASRLAWLADSVRPSCDLSVFRVATGGGRPLFGAHGELLLVRASVESSIGWDFGRLLSITEDANFALLFAARYPGASGWVPARCYGSSPESMRDLITQRKRWARGLLHVARNREVPFRSRILLGYAMSSWVLGPFQHVLVVLLVAFALGIRFTAPVQPWLLLPWALNMASGLWMYIEGLRVNAHASGLKRPKAGHWLGLLLFPFFSLIEGWAALRGLGAFLLDLTGIRRGDLFEVIPKSYDGAPETQRGETSVA